MIGAAMLIPSLLQAGLGAAQYFGGRKLAQTPVPEYEIAPALQTAVKQQRTASQSDMAGLQEMIQQQRQSTANTFENMSKFGMVDPNTVSALAGQERGVVGNIGLQNAQYRTGEKDKYLNMLQVLANEQNRKWDWETRLPAERDWAAGSALMGSGIQNIWGGVSSAGDMLGQRQMMSNLGYNVPSMWGNMFNQNQSASNGVITNPYLRNELQTMPQAQKAQLTGYNLFAAQNPYLPQF